ncbi:sugar phosphate isomerase/epimerase family protein [Chitinophaga sp. 22620]|uniref:sugar phosphate isomerase/epimerase family protein n=1 Tax=Chitinophaga sp. 22620 TaxID=3453952 RepID=UPI003F85BDB6
MTNEFELKILGTGWGFTGTIDELCGRIKKEGYDGIEVLWPAEKKAQEELFAALEKYELELGLLCAGFDSDYQKHLEEFIAATNEAATQTIRRPLFINCHSGRDHFSYEQNKAFIDHTTRLSRVTGITICHETHRARILYSAPAARHYLHTIPELRITFDVSHWCNVSESLLEDQQETLDLALSRTDHIHARIGHPEGPQVSDPRAPEWEPAVKAHLDWWDKIVEAKRKAGKRLTILTEFGPPDYMPTLPYSRDPLSDQWAINVYMLQLLRERYIR